MEIYNDSIHSTTGFTPRSALLGTDVPLDVSYRQVILENIRKSQEKSEKRLNEPRKQVNYPVGCKVLVFNASGANRGKLDPLYIGPVKVLRKQSDQMYEVDLHGRPSLQNVRNLRPFQEEAAPLPMPLGH